MEFLKRLFSPVTATVSFIQNHFKASVLILIVILIFWPSDNQNFKPVNLQQINVHGPIMDATIMVEQIDAAREDESIRGVLIDINSPGGGVAPSLEVAYAIKRLQAVKPVVVYGSGMMASGGYYAAIWSNEIIANPGAMVGSIGVIMQGANLSELMEKIGIATQVVKAGKFKQVGTPDRQWTAEERKELEKVISGTYKMFVSDVADARGLDVRHSDTFAEARIFTAAQAKDVGLIDTLGVRYDAMRRVEELSGVAEPEWQQEDKIDRFFKRLAAESSTLINTWFPAQALR
jgi:protease-4